MLLRTTVLEFDGLLYVDRGSTQPAIIKKGGAYYLTDDPINAVEQIFGCAKRVFDIDDSPLGLVFVIGLILSGLACYFATESFVLVDADFLVAGIVLAVNVLIHELGHACALWALCPGSSVRFGAKLVLPFPCFYVDTSDSYLLPDCKRLVVYLAGIASNALFVLVVCLLPGDCSSCCYLVVSMMLINLVPIMKGDGYYCMQVLLGKAGLAHDARRTLAEDFIRGLAMLMLLLALSLLL